MDSKNFIQIRKWSLGFNYFCFIDTKEYLADALFVRRKVRVWFREEFRRDDTEYIFIFCKVCKKDTKEFLVALQELKNKMLLCGHGDYLEFCEKMGVLTLSCG